MGGFEPVTPDVLTVAAVLPARGFWDGATPDDVDGGFEAELAAELAERLGQDGVEVVDVAFEDLVAGDVTGYDLGLSQVSITAERRKVVDFSRPYLTTAVGVVGRPGTDASDLAAARELRWGVVRATTEEDLVDDALRPDDEPRSYADESDPFAAVARGDVDVVAVDLVRGLAEVSAATADAPDLELVARINDPQHYGAVLPKGSDNRDAVDAVLRALAADGTLDRLRDDLFDGFDVSTWGLPTIRVPQ